MAPGVSAAGQELQWMTSEEALATVQDHVESHKVVIDGVETTAGDLGYEATVADLDSHRAWSVNNWNEPVTVDLLEPTGLEEDLTELLQLRAPVDAVPRLDEGEWRVIPGEEGHTVDFEEFTPTLTASIRRGETVTEVSRETLQPEVTTEEAEAVVKMVNDAALDAAVTLDGEVLVEITPDEYSRLVNISADGGEVTVSVDEERVESLVSEAVEAARIKSDPGVAVVDESGTVLKTLESFHDGRKVTSEQAEELRKEIVEGLVSGENQFSVESTVVPAKIDGRYRNAVVDRSARMAYFYENGTEVYRFPVAVGKPGWETDVGSFRVHTQLVSQDMGCGSALYDYCVKDVPWVTYFNNDEGFHGTYWHSDFGNPSSSARSHGCVNMSPENAYFVYKFLQTGSPVEVVR